MANLIYEICNKENIDKEVNLNGWVNSLRIMGKIGFIELRDLSGKIQIVIKDKEILESAKKLTEESVISVRGELSLKKGDNTKFELFAKELIIHNIASSLPFTNKVIDELNITDEIKQKYRYIYLRTEKAQKNAIARSKVVKIMRDFLYDNGFNEIETPILSKSTPEGARDFLVPSRVNKGNFYALPQSPQIYKQLLMVAGMHKYFQIAKCFRDEDLRADRQPEFTQLDIELSFTNEEEIMNLTENLLKRIWKEIKGIDIKTPFKKIDFNIAVKKYGSDKPDLRFGLEFKEEKDKVFFEVENNPDVLEYLKDQKEVLYDLKNKIRVYVEKPKEEFDFKPYFLLGECRLKIGDILGLRKGNDRFLWVINFPMFEYSEEDKRFKAMHHPFTMPLDIEGKKLWEIKSRAYDIVLNGVELGGGSIRIHKKDLQNKVFALLGISEKDAKNKFGFFLNAFDTGMPPHGGIAFGLDRLLMLLVGVDSIREVMAFPKNKNAEGLMENSPSNVDNKQLGELGLELKK